MSDFSDPGGGYYDPGPTDYTPPEPETPVEAPVDTPPEPETPVEAPVDTPPEPETPVEAPVDTPPEPETPVEAPVDSPPATTMGSPEVDQSAVPAASDYTPAGPSQQNYTPADPAPEQNYTPADPAPEQNYTPADPAPEQNYTPSPVNSTVPGPEEIPLPVASAGPTSSTFLLDEMGLNPLGNPPSPGDYASMVSTTAQSTGGLATGDSDSTEGEPSPGSSTEEKTLTQQVIQDLVKNAALRAVQDPMGLGLKDAVDAATTWVSIVDNYTAHPDAGWEAAITSELTSAGVEKTTEALCIGTIVAVGASTEGSAGAVAGTAVEPGGGTAIGGTVGVTAGVLESAEVAEKICWIPASVAGSFTTWWREQQAPTNGPDLPDPGDVEASQWVSGESLALRPWQIDDHPDGGTPLSPTDGSLNLGSGQWNDPESGWTTFGVPLSPTTLGGDGGIADPGGLPLPPPLIGAAPITPDLPDLNIILDPLNLGGLDEPTPLVSMAAPPLLSNDEGSGDPLDFLDPASTAMTIPSSDEQGISAGELMTWQNEGGFQGHCYTDSEGHPTVGIGFNLDSDGAAATLASVGADYDAVRAGTQDLTLDQAVVIYNQTYARAEQDAQDFAPNWNELSEGQQQALTDMAFNLGPVGLGHFVKLEAALQDGDFEEAANQMLDSLWAQQVGGRAVRDANLMRGAQ